jgi:hypothetical protein
MLMRMLPAQALPSPRPKPANEMRQTADVFGDAQFAAVHDGVDGRFWDDATWCGAPSK